MDTARTSRAIVWFWPLEKSEALMPHQRNRTLGYRRGSMGRPCHREVTLEDYRRRVRAYGEGDASGKL